MAIEIASAKLTMGVPNATGCLEYKTVRSGANVTTKCVRPTSFESGTPVSSPDGPGEKSANAEASEPGATG